MSSMTAGNGGGGVSGGSSGGGGGGSSGGGGVGGGHQKQPSTGLLSAMASLNPFGKSKGAGKGSSSSSSGLGGRGAGTGGRNGATNNETVPRSYGLNGGHNRADSDQSVGMEERLGMAGVGSRGDGSAAQSNGSNSSSEDRDGANASIQAEGVAPQRTVGKTTRPGLEDSPSTLFEGKETDIELGFPADYIIGYWKSKEERKFIDRMRNAQQPPPEYPAHRRYMVDWISEVGEQLDLQTVTIHSAVSFLDEMMLLVGYNTRDWHLNAVCCLSIAAKYEEAECNMPMITELADATEMSLTTPLVTRRELELVQNKLQWDVSRVTAMHFLGYYTSQGVTMAEDTCQGRRLVPKVVVYMNKYVDFFANLCQQDYQFQRYRPSHIAAAAILAARRALCIKPVWRDELTDLTGYKVEDIIECGEDLWHFYEQMFPTHKPLRTDTTLAYKKAAERAAAGSGAGAGAAPSSGSNAAMGSIAQ